MTEARPEAARPRTVLVANRGEIALRILRTCKRMGMRTVAVASDVDLTTPHAMFADVVVNLGPPEAASSYLRMDRILEAAIEQGVTDIHPGFGFLAENADFARAVVDAGIRFVGPNVEAIEAMGSKIDARRVLDKTGIAPIPGTPVEGPDDPRLADPALSYPLLVKASAGGGGKGMRRVDAPADLPAAIDACRREAESAFGDGALLVERLIEDARHVEVQILGDRHGTVVALLERDCSLQRRHQKVLEECPAPGLSDQTRANLRDSAIAVAKAVGYDNAGTIEFLVEPDGACHFLEMNTRLQVEHPVTELVAGLDLVEWQLRVADGARLPEEFNQIVPHGHAVEVRLYAEDPMTGFLPSTGRIETLVLPQGPGIRVDSGVRQGDEVTPYYDPMLAKVISWGPDRQTALDTLAAALCETHVLGVRTNLELLRWLLDHEVVRGSAPTTTFLESAVGEFVESEARQPGQDEIIAAAVALAMAGGGSARAHRSTPGAWDMLTDWRL